MIRLRRVHSATLPADRDRISQVQEIFRNHFPDARAYSEKIPSLLDQPFKEGYRTFLIIAESVLGKVKGFSLLSYFSEVRNVFLDYLAVGQKRQGGGIGSALYEATRGLALALGASGLYLEAMPDDSERVSDPKILRENRQRLRFYEHYGVRPIIGTKYETPIGNSPAPHLLFDGLNRTTPLGRAECRKTIRLILERKYSHLVGADYIKSVVNSVTDDPVRIRPPRYLDAGKSEFVPVEERIEKIFALVWADSHRIHHVKERGYVERPARVDVLRDALKTTGLFNEYGAREYPEKYLRSVHDDDFVGYLKAVCNGLSNKRPVYPYVFPIRRKHRRPRELAVRAGYYCIDTFTPLDRNAYTAARAAANAALTAADELLAGRPVVYALCRPPGHHAERHAFGGFCYFNNAAIAAQRLSQEGKVAVLDIDFHHGNGTQDIFWQRADVLTVSLHGHPNWSYPYFSGFSDERGEGLGLGFNRNFPLPEHTGEEAYLEALGKACDVVRQFKPELLVVSIGFDIMKGDPTGGFVLTPKSLRKIGQRLGSFSLPTLVVQEGGYSLRNLRRGAPAFFLGMEQVWGIGSASLGMANP